MKKISCGCRGYTLIEFVVVIVVLGVIVALVSNLLGRAFDSYFHNQETMQRQSASLLVMRYLTGELKRIRAPSDLISATPVSIYFKNEKGRLIMYSLIGNRLMRDEGGARVLADKVKTFTLSYFDVSGSPTTNLQNIAYFGINFATQQADGRGEFNTLIYPRYE